MPESTQNLPVLDIAPTFAPGDGGGSTRAMFTVPGTAIPVLIVTFGNASDAMRCLRALGRMRNDPSFAVFICENGGAAAFDEQIALLTSRDGVCDQDAEPDGTPMLVAPRLVRIARLRLRDTAAGQLVRVHIGQAAENMGYAGGVNAFLGPMLETPGWPGAWILNPDTQPDADALHELKTYSTQHARFMVGSRLISDPNQNIVQLRGLAWRRWRGATAAVDRLGPAIPTQPMELLENRLDASSGASVYVTRLCILQIGLMDERYFLYFEDLEWGLRGKRCSPIGYAFKSVVVHECGTTTGSSSSRRSQSPLATYLDCRNRLLFVRRHFGGWLAWMALIEMLEIADYARRREFGSMRAAAGGLLAGLRNRGGRPDSMLESHALHARAGNAAVSRSRYRPTQSKDRLKVGISVGAYAVLLGTRKIARLFRPAPPPALNILYYHGITADCVAGFARQMRQLAGWARVVRADWTGDGIADARPAVAITFDDAFDSVLDRALPILAEFRFPCTIFVPTGHVGQLPSWNSAVVSDERVASADRLARLDADLVTLGSHTETHPHLPSLPADAIRRELTRSADFLTALTGEQPRLFAFPYGARGEQSEAACRELGYERVFTIEPIPVVFADGAFARGRVAVEPWDGRLEFFLKATGCYRWMPWVSTVKRTVWRLLRRSGPELLPDPSQLRRS